MRVVALFRVSTEKQASEGASLDAQQRIYRGHAAKNGWETVAEFRGCESATQAASDRRVLQQVLACLRDNSPDAVYVHEQSRLTRGDELEVALLFRELRERGLKIIINGVVRDLASIDERFMLGIQSLVDRAESERIKERMGRGKRERARQGKKCSGPAPLGYVNPPPGAPGRGTLQIVPEEAVVVRRLFALAAKGLGDAAVATELNRAGMAASRGGLWGKTSVRRALQNPAYVGIAASGVWKRVPGTRRFRLDLSNDGAVVKENAHEAIIDRETWDAVHGRPRRPRTGKPRLLTGMLRINGEPASGDSDHGTRFYRAVRGKRGLPWIAADIADAEVWDWFVRHATSPEQVARFMEQASSPKEQAVLAQEAEYLAEQIAKHERRLERLVDMRADGEISKEAFAAKTAEARGAAEGLRAELAGIRAKQVSADGSHAERVVRAVQTLLAGRTRLTTEQKRAVLASIVRRVDLTVEPTGARQGKAEGGRFAAGRVARWAVRGVAFQLALPAGGWGQDAARANVGQPAANGAGGERDGAGEPTGLRTGQLVTMPSVCAQVAGTESDKSPDLRTGQLVTTY